MYEFGIFIILPFITSLICFFIKKLKLQYGITVFTALLHLILAVIIFTKSEKIYLPEYFAVDAVSKYFLLILSNIYFWVVLVSLSYLQSPIAVNMRSGKKYYFALLNFYLAVNSAAMLSNHFGMYWVSSEATTLSVAPLIYFYRNEESLEAMWKYLFLVSIGIAFAFIGILFLSLAAKGIGVNGRELYFSDLLNNAVMLNPIWLKASFIFIFVGLSTKIGIAPMHYGDIDATSSAPSPIAALMSGSLRLTALIGVLRIYQITSLTQQLMFAKTLLIFGGMLSVFVAFIYMFKVNNYKRMLAYSSVEHLGIITLALGTGGLAFIGALYHALYNSITKVILFVMAGKIHNHYGSKEVENINGVLKILPITGWLFLIAFLGISGIPPLGIFFSELKIFEGILFSNNWYVLFILMFFLLFIFINMGKVIFTMFYKINGEIKITHEKFDSSHLVAIILLIILIILSVSAPEILLNNVLNIAKDFGIEI